MTRWDKVENGVLLDELRRCSPDVKTLCEGWQTRHLAAHLYLRRHRPWAAFNEKPGSAFDTLATQASDPTEYHRLVDDFAAAPASGTPMSLFDGPMGPLANLMEYLLHVEDIRRGAGPVPARHLPAEQLDAIFDATVRMATLTMRKAATGVVLAVPGGRRAVVRRAPDAVAVTGSPVELALVISGRRRAADVEVIGADATVAAFEAAAH